MVYSGSHTGGRIGWVVWYGIHVPVAEAKVSELVNSSPPPPLDPAPGGVDLATLRNGRSDTPLTQRPD